MSVVWILREMRSGSTAFTSLVAGHLNRAHNEFVSYPLDIDIVKNVDNPEDYLFSTHSYDFLEIMDTFDKPVTLIRCARRDRVERCISYLFIKHRIKRFPKTHFHNQWNVKRNDTEGYQNFLSEISEPTVFTKKEIYNYLSYWTRMNHCWERYSSLYQNQTVYYEDLCTSEGVSIPILGLDSLSISGDHAATIKFPEFYKKQNCLNYDMVEHWINEYYRENEY